VAIEIKYFKGFKPIRGLGRVPGYTDFRCVYISSDLGGRDRDIIIKHELAHIYLQHNSRRLAFESTKDKPLDGRKWNIAIDLEIAYHIYSEEDNAYLRSPFSALSQYRPYVKDDCNSYPNCMYAEQFYDLIPDQARNSHDGDFNIDLSSLEELAEKLKELGLEEVDLEVIVKEAKEEIESHLSSIHAQQFADQEAVALPRPSLASALDAHLGRSKVTPERSYRRLPRRESEEGFIRPGRLLKVKAPKVTVYVDRSGSFCAEKTAKAQDALREVLQKYRTQIECDILYFNDGIMNVDPIYGGGGTNYGVVWKQICLDRAEVAVVITDSDPCLNLERADVNVVVIHIGEGSSSFGAATNATVFRA